MDRTHVRRDVLAELMVLAREHAAQHAQQYQTALELGQEEMARSAYADQDAWMEVARVLKLEMERG
jgi:hypothetical protein